MDCVSMYLNGLYILLYYSADLVSGPLKTSFKCLLYSGGEHRLIQDTLQ